MLSYAFTTLDQDACEDVAVFCGKIDMPRTIQNQLARKRVLDCEYDELSENDHQILKTTQPDNRDQMVAISERLTQIKNSPKLLHSQMRLRANTFLPIKAL